MLRRQSVDGIDCVVPNVLSTSLDAPFCVGDVATFSVVVGTLFRIMPLLQLLLLVHRFKPTPLELECRMTKTSCNKLSVRGGGLMSTITTLSSICGSSEVSLDEQLETSARPASLGVGELVPMRSVRELLSSVSLSLSRWHILWPAPLKPLTKPL